MSAEQTDLFTEPRVRIAQPDVFTPKRVKPERVGHRARRIATSSIDARPSESAHAEIRDKVLACIKEAGSQGRTRQEVADRTGIKLQSVCSSVVKLIQLDRAFERLVGHTPRGNPIHARREGRNIVCASGAT